MRRMLLGVCLLGGALSLGSSPALAQVAASTVVLNGASGTSCVYTGITMQPNGGISVTCSGGAATAPGAPVIGAAVPGDTSASISFTAGTAGSTATTGYTASCSVSGTAPFAGTGTGASSPIVVTGLTNATAYLCSVTATNSVGTSPASDTVGVTPAAPTVVPGPPVIGAATPGNTTAIIAFSPPLTGGGGITSYKAYCSVSGAAPWVGSQPTGASSPLTVTGLVNATTYLCSVTATNVVGEGAASGTVSVTPAAPTAPGAPTGVTATPGSGSISVAFTAPASNGGSAITGYTASCASSDGGAPGSGTGAASPITVSGLDNGKTYTCTVTATNGIGTSDPSAASGTAVPVAGCGATPVGTTIVTWSGYSNAGAGTETGTISTGNSKAFRFTASSTLYPTGNQIKTETTTATGGSNRADITIATCPGVFTSPQPLCVLTSVKLSNKLTSFDPLAAATDCILQNGLEYYVNIRPNAAYSNVAKVLSAQGR